MKKQKKGTHEAAETDIKTGTTVTTVEVDVEAADVQLSPEEEKVIRMRYGKSIDGQEALEFAGGATDETKLKLALIEANLLEAFDAEALDADPATGAPRSVIADRLEH